MGNTICPKCSARIPPADVNVAEGIAFCRACETVTRLVGLAEDPALMGADPAEPPKGCGVSSDGVETVVTASAKSVGGAIGALFICLFWNGIASVFVLVAAAGTLKHTMGNVPAWFPAPPMNGSSGAGMPLGMVLFLWVFLMPFIAIGLVMLMVFLVCLGGRVEAKMRGDQGVVFIGIGAIGWRRRFDPGKVTAVAIGETTWKQNDQAKPVIVLTADRVIRFGSTLPEERRNWMAATLKRMLVVK